MTNIEKFSGAFTAIPTPFDNGRNRVDFERLKSNIKRQLEFGVRGVVPVGTTGESPTLSHDEHRMVIAETVRVVREYKPTSLVIGGTGSNSTAEAIELTLSAGKAGVDAVLVVAPYYNKPPQVGLFNHFAAIAKVVPGLPIILYNIPSRCGVEISIEVVRALADMHKNIIGIKEAGGSVERVSELVRTFTGKDFVILSGDDSMTLPFIALGAHGVVSIVSNVIPASVVNLVTEMEKGDVAAARQIHYELLPLVRLLFKEVNPIGVKCALKLLELDSGFVRSPLTEASGGLEEELKERLALLKLL